MKEVTEILRLLAKAIEQNTVNTYREQGSAAVDVVFRILEDAEKRIETLKSNIEKSKAEIQKHNAMLDDMRKEDEWK